MKKKLQKVLFTVFAVCISFLIPAMESEASGIYSYWYNGKYVWTTDAGDKSIENVGGLGYTVYTGTRKTNKQSDMTGKHYYTGIPDNIYIGKWVYSTGGICCHWGSNKMGIKTHEIQCGAAYQNRYLGYCADCGRVIDLYITGSSDTMQSIDQVPNGSCYYYLCPHEKYVGLKEGDMEQGADFTHKCPYTVSANQYKIKYNFNYVSGSKINSSKPDSSMEKGYYYNNATLYEGRPVRSKTTLMDGILLQSNCNGYLFDGWYTAPNGGVKVETWADLQAATPSSVLNVDESVINVYAHWSKCSGTLTLNDAGVKENITVEYNKSATVRDGNQTTPVTIILNANGGTCEKSSITSVKTFDHWVKGSPFYMAYSVSDKTVTNTYKVNGAVSTLTAYYNAGSVILPTPKRTGYEFLGWKNESGAVVGLGGQSYTPDGNKSTVTLTAAWNAINLSLSSVEDYTVNNGAGAVDLTWNYTGKTSLSIFKIYESNANLSNAADTSKYTLVRSAADIKNTEPSAVTYTADATYTVPQTGYYVIESYGGKGANYGSYVGGKGGYTYTKVFLKAGQKVKVYTGGVGTASAGGSNSAGYSGGTPSGYGGGGGATVITVDDKLLAVAAGGGGASGACNGINGGDGSSSLVSTNAGASGQAGGGGGYRGGAAGTLNIHYHSDGCYQAGSASEIAGNRFFSDSTFATNMTTESYVSNDSQYGYLAKKEYDSNSVMYSGYGNKDGITLGGRIGSATNYVETPGTGYLYVDLTIDNNGGVSTSAGIKVCNKDGGYVGTYDIFAMPYTATTADRYHDSCCKYPVKIVNWTYDNSYFQCNNGDIHGNYAGYCGTSNSYWGVQAYTSLSGTLRIPIGDNVNGIYLEVFSTHGGPPEGTSSTLKYSVSNVHYDYSYNNKICAYENGQVISSNGGYGGSNYSLGVGQISGGNGAYVLSSSYQNSANVGINNGAGYAKITPAGTGFQTVTSMNDVIAPDINKPQMPNFVSIERSDDGKSAVIEWSTPKDTGTTYHFYCQAVNLDNTNVIAATSNTTTNVITSGLKKYYYVIDGSSGTTVTASNKTGESTNLNQIQKRSIALTYSNQWFHVAYVDVAGNLGDTLTIPLGALNAPPPAEQCKHGELNVPTLTLTNAGADGVYLTGSTVFVRADELTGAEFKITGSINNTYGHFFIDKLLFKENENKDTNVTVIPLNDYRVQKATTASKTDSYLSAMGEPTVTISSDKKNVTSSQVFVLAKDGACFALTPEIVAECANADCDYTASKSGSGYTVKGDALEPDIKINGSWSVNDSRNISEVSTYLGSDIPFYKFSTSAGTFTFKFTAADPAENKGTANEFAGSGIASVKVYLGRMITDENLVSSTNGGTVTISKDGIYTYTVIARDNVGNQKEVVVEVNRDTKIPLIQDNTTPDPNDPDDVDNYIEKTALDKNGNPVDSNLTSFDCDTYYYEYGWRNKDIILKYLATDSSGLKELGNGKPALILYRGWNATDANIIAYGTAENEYSTSLTYVVNIEGITKYTLTAEDVYGHKVTIYITVKIDYTAPAISGLELIKDLEGLNRADYVNPIEITVKACDVAEDAVSKQSGMKEFTLTVTNHDNGLVRVYSTDPGKASGTEYVGTISEDGLVAQFKFNILEDDLVFVGDWTVAAYAEDNVRNISTDEGDLSEFTLEAELHSKINADEFTPEGYLALKAGEAAILKVTTGGYADVINVDFTDLNNAGLKIYRGVSGEIATEYDPTNMYDYNPDNIMEITGAYDYVKLGEQPNGRFTVYYQIVLPVELSQTENGEYHEIKITAYKGIEDFTVDENGHIIGKDGKEIQVNESAVIGSTVNTLNVKTPFIIQGSSVNDFCTTIKDVK